MRLVAVATDSGLRTFSPDGETQIELADRRCGGLTQAFDGRLLAIVDGTEICLRSSPGRWSLLARTPIELQSLVAVGTSIYAGGMEEASVFRIDSDAGPESPPQRLEAFDRVPGREAWFAGGPPLGVRSMAATCDGRVLLAAVHVGGIPISADRGASWTPTISIHCDVHEVRAHSTQANVVAAAAAAGLCVSQDAGSTWRVFSEGIEAMTVLAVAVLENEVLFSAQDSPFASRSQIWKWTIGASRTEPVREGLPEWLTGKVDTGGMAARAGWTAIVDGGGNLWLSMRGCEDWRKIAEGLPYPWGVAIVES